MTSPDAPPAPFATLSRATALSAPPVLRVDRLTRRSGRTGALHDVWQLVLPDWVNVVALTRDGDLLLVRQERHGVEASTLEIPGGVVDEGETPAAAAARELREETGHRGAPAVALGWVHPNPALQTNRCHTFLVRDCVPVEAPRGDAGEELEVVRVPASSAPELVRRGKVTHALVVAALSLWASADGRGSP
jgi:8-oxo-dGTP pyrophosphatase MutT (NUDIX family)